MRFRYLVLLLTALLAAALASGKAAAQTTYTVTTTADEGAGSLRQAILDANAHAGADVIAFDLAGAGPHVIAPASALPVITDPVVIDGLTQAGADCSAQPKRLRVVLQDEGLRIEADDSAVRGFVFQGMRTALRILGSRNDVTCNFVGTDASGTAATSAQRVQAFIELGDFGLSCSGNRVGEPGQGNVFGGSSLAGVGDSCDGTVYQGNWFGIAATGNAAIGGVPRSTLALSGTGYQVGGAGPGEGNAFARGGLSGSTAMVALSSGRVQGNTFGTLPDGSLLPNDGGDVLRGGSFGISIFEGSQPADVLVGGLDPGAGNLFRGMAFGAIRVGGDIVDEDIGRAAILGNRLFDNYDFRGTGRELWLQIEVGQTGSAVVGFSDTDAPPPPTLFDLPPRTTASSARVRGRLDAAPNQAYRIEVFAGGGCGLQRIGAAQYVVGAFEVTTNASGRATFDRTLATSGVPEGEIIAATATSVVDGSAENGVTSELSACLPFPTDPLLVDRPYDVSAGLSGSRTSRLPGSLRFAIEHANATAGRDTIRFAIPTDEDLPGCDAATGVCTVLFSGPAITDPVVVDGLTQPGSACGGTTPATLRIGIEATDSYGLVFERGAEGSELSGVAAHGGSTSSVRVDGVPVRLGCSFFGTDAAGTRALGGGSALRVDLDGSASAGTVQVGAPGEPVLIAGASVGLGVNADPGSPLGLVVQNAWIGPDATGAPGIGSGTGVVIDRDVEGALLGGGAPGEAVWIAYNRRVGVRLEGSTSDPAQGPRGVSILGSRVHGNDTDPDPRQVGPPIQLSSAFAPRANDAGDGDEGPNRGMNTPEIAGALAYPAGHAEVTYRVDADPAHAAYPLRVEFFEAAASDVYPGGVRYLGSDTVPQSRAGQTRTATLSPSDPITSSMQIVATATDAEGNTSEITAVATTVPNEGEPARPSAFALGTPFPNPASGAATLTLELPAPRTVTVEVFDALGRRVAVLAEGERPAGWYPLTLDTRRLASGVYLVRARTDAEEAVRRITVVR